MPGSTKRRAALKADIDEVIDMYKTRQAKKPPFTAAELIVMAVVCDGAQWLCKQDILLWILRTFPYYGNEALKKYTEDDADHDTQWGPQPSRRSDVIEGFGESLGRYALPIHDYVEQPDALRSDREINHYGPIVHASRVYLRHLLEPQRKGVFPFFSLPAELRNTIYEMLFLFDEGGCKLSFIGSAFRRGVAGRDTVVTGQILDRNETAFYQPRTVLSRPSETLTPLLTCKQFFKEAMSYFYRDNHFEFSVLSGFSEVVTQLAPSRVAELSNFRLSLQIYRGGSELLNFAAGMRALTAVRKPKQLAIVCYREYAWLKMRGAARQALGVTRSRPFNKYDSIPGFEDLALVAGKAEALTFEGECPKLKDYIIRHIEKSKKALEAASKPKRKRGGKQVEGNGEGVDSVRKRTRRAKAAAATAAAT